jgi:hypothetical protein
MHHALGGHRHQRNGNLRIVHARAGEHGADGELSIGDVEMEFVTAPVLLVPLAAGLDADVALPRKLFQHPFQLLMALPLDPLSVLSSFLFGKNVFFSLSRTWFAGLLFRLLRPLSLRPLQDRFGKTFPYQDRRRVPGDVSDQALLLRCRDHRCMQLLG